MGDTGYETRPAPLLDRIPVLPLSWGGSYWEVCTPKGPSSWRHLGSGMHTYISHRTEAALRGHCQPLLPALLSG